MADGAAEDRNIVADNIDTVLRLEQQLQARDSRWSDRLNEAITGVLGTLGFVVVTLGFVTSWIAFNEGAFGRHPFDPFPFNLLSLGVSTAGVLIAVLVLIRQGREAQIAERREHFHMQVNLLTEREVTHLLQMMEQVLHKLGVWDSTESLGEMTKVTNLETVVASIDAKLDEQQRD